jgi:hypothetical protein
MSEENTETIQEDTETIERIVRLAFGGDRGRFDRFLERLRETTPEDGSVILRGSAVTGTRWSDGAPFDSDGPGTSDLDLTFVGGDMTSHFEGFYIPGMHTLPLSEEHPNACPALVPLREELCGLARRPVNIQATRSVVQYARDILMGQPYVMLIARRDGKPDEDDDS